MKRWGLLSLLVAFDVFGLWWTIRLSIVVKFTAMAFEPAWAIFIQEQDRHIGGFLSFIAGQSRPLMVWLTPLFLSGVFTLLYVCRERRRQRQIST